VCSPARTGAGGLIGGLQRRYLYEACLIAAHYDRSTLFGGKDENGRRATFTNELISFPQTHPGAVLAQLREEDGAYANPLIRYDGSETLSQFLRGGKDHWLSPRGFSTGQER
jgi:hypothetical protein